MNAEEDEQALRIEVPSEEQNPPRNRRKRDRDDENPEAEQAEAREDDLAEMLQTLCDTAEAGNVTLEREAEELAQQIERAPALEDLVNQTPAALSYAVTLPALQLKLQTARNKLAASKALIKKVRLAAAALRCPTECAAPLQQPGWGRVASGGAALVATGLVGGATVTAIKGVPWLTSTLEEMQRQVAQLFWSH